MITQVLVLNGLDLSGEPSPGVAESIDPEQPTGGRPAAP